MPARRIHLLENSLEEIKADMRSLSIIAEVHRKESLHTAFFENKVDYPATEEYCRYKNIPAVNIDKKESEDIAKEISNYAEKHPAYTVYAHISRAYAIPLALLLTKKDFDTYIKKVNDAA